MIEERISRRAADRQARQTARRVGWARIGLGLASLIAPQRVARWTGRAGHELTVRVVGLRELVCGIGLVTSAEPRAWMWNCVAGDAMDLGLLAAQAHGDPRQAPQAAAALVAVAGITLADVQLARRMTPALEAHEPTVDYRQRSGFPKPPDEMRGAALRRLPGALGSIDGGAQGADDADGADGADDGSRTLDLPAPRLR